MSEKTSFQYADRVSAEQTAGYLRQVADGLRRGSMTLEGQGQQITLSPSSLVKLEIKAEGYEGKGELQVEVSWKPLDVTSAETLQVVAGAEAAEADTSPQSLEDSRPDETVEGQ